jgi:hypothetical protein
MYQNSKKKYLIEIDLALYQFNAEFSTPQKNKKNIF